MRKSLHTTLGLLGVCFALLIWYFGYERTYRVKQETADDKAKLIVALEKEQIQELEIDRLSNVLPEGTAYPADFKPVYETVKLRKSGTDWNLYHPLQDAADSSTVGSMVGTLTSTKQDRVVDDNPKDLNQFGLAYPVIKIRIRKDAAAPVEEVMIGANTPVGFNAYAKNSGSPSVYRVGRGLRTSFEKTLKDMRNKSILNIPRLDVAEVEISAAPGRQSTVLKKDPKKDEWTLARDNMPAETSEWNKTLNAVLDAKAVNFADNSAANLATFGLAKPIRIFTIVKNDKTKLSVSFGRAKVAQVKEAGKDLEKVYMKRDDKETIYEVEKDLLTKVERPADAYRSLLIVKFNRYDTNRMKLDQATDSIDLKKENGKWQFSSDDKTIVDATKVDGLLTRLQDIKLEKFMTEHTAKLTDAATALTIRIFEKKPDEKPADPKAPAAPSAETEVAVLKFGKAKNKLVTVERSDLAIPFLIKESDFQSLNLKKADLIQTEKKEEPKKEPVKKS